MHPIEQQVYGFLEDVCTRKATIDPALFTEFGQRCESVLRKHLLEDGVGEFTLRMSNIGKPLRQLMLEKNLGRGTPTPDFLLKMLAGTLDEAFVVFLLKASGVNITGLDKRVTLEVTTDKGPLDIEGTLDVQIDGETWDIKTASPYSYDNKFSHFEELAAKDDFGYMAQGFGYGAATGTPFRGWIVRNKATQELKVVEIPAHLHDKLQEQYLGEIQAKANHITMELPIPECQGSVPETFYKKPTGNYVLSDECKFCPHKQRCHPGIEYRIAPGGKAGTPKYKYYTKVVEDDEQS